MKQQFQAQVLRIYVGEDDKWQSGVLFPAIVDRLKSAGIAGVTVLHGIEGYGAHGKLHTERFEIFFQGLPIVIEAIDTPERITSVLPILEELVSEGLVTIHDVQVLRYTKA